MNATNYAELRAIDVSKYMEDKNGLNYIPWAWAVDQLLCRDPQATWEYKWFDGKPYLQVFDTWMVFCTVKAFGVERTVQLPIFDFKNKAIASPNAMDLNTTMMRCLAKAISLHGIGINVYAGEDMPLSVSDACAGYTADMQHAKDLDELEAIAVHVRDFTAEYPTLRDELAGAYERNKARLTNKAVAGSKKSGGVTQLKQHMNNNQEKGNASAY